MVIKYRDLPIYFVDKFETTWNGREALRQLYNSKSYCELSFEEFLHFRSDEEIDEQNKVLEEAWNNMSEKDKLQFLNDRFEVLKQTNRDCVDFMMEIKCNKEK